MDFRDQFRKMSDDVTKMARDVADTSKKATALMISANTAPLPKFSPARLMSSYHR